jgi:hypothetical protein
VQHPLSARRQAPKGVIDTLSAGYVALNRQLWVLLVPILVDLLLWLGPHVSYSPLVDPTVTRATEWVRQAAATSSPSPGAPRRGQPRAVPGTTGTPGGDVAGRLEAFRAWTMSRTTDTNALSLLARGPLVVPSLAAPLGAAGVVGSIGALQFVTGWPEGVLLLAALLAAGLLLGGVFYGGIAGASLGAAGGPVRAGRGAPRVALRVAGLVATLLGVGLLLGLPVVLLVGFTALVEPELAVLGGALVLGALLFAELHLFFAVDAICVSDVGPLAAVQRSVGIVRRDPWSTLGLIVLTWLILAGMSRVWELLAGSLQAPFGVALASLGNAYIASGLIAAGMIFYTERVESLSPMPSASAPAPA